MKPLKPFYRTRPVRLDSMQSAVAIFESLDAPQRLPAAKAPRKGRTPKTTTKRGTP